MKNLATIPQMFDSAWVALGLLAFAVVMLEAERWWTRWRRRRGRRIGASAYVMDGLAVSSAMLCIASALVLLIRGLIAGVLFAGELFGWVGAQVNQKPWILIVPVGMLVIIGAAIGFRRGWLRLPQRRSAAGPGGRASSDRAGVSERTATAPVSDSGAPGTLAASAISTGAHTAAASAAHEHEHPGPPPPYAVPGSAFAATPLPATQAAATRSTTPGAYGNGPVASPDPAPVMAQRRRPPPPVAVPQSFLTSAPLIYRRRRSRMPLLIALLVGVAMGGLAFLFLPPIFTPLAESRAHTSQATKPTILAPSSPIPSTAAPSAPTPEPPLSKRVKSSVLNLRAGPGTDQPIIATLRQGAEVVLLHDVQTIAGRSWVKVRAGQQEGWVSQEFLE